MRLRHVEVFHAVMSTGSITSAARLLNVSQPAVTKILHHAEDQLGFKLFDRVKGRLVPTREGELLFDKAEQLHDCLDSIRTLAANLRRTSEGALRIAAPPALCIAVVPGAIARFRQANPQTSFVVETLHYAEAVDAMLTLDMDMAITFSAHAHPGIDRVALATGCFCAVLPRGGRYADCAALPPEAFETMPFIGLSRADPVAAVVHRAMESAGVVAVPEIEVKTYGIALSLVRANAGFALVDQYTAASAGPDVDVKPLPWFSDFDVNVMTAKYAPLPRLGQAFVAMLRVVEQELAGTFAPALHPA